MNRTNETITPDSFTLIHTDPSTDERTERIPRSHSEVARQERIAMRSLEVASERMARRAIERPAEFEAYETLADCYLTGIDPELAQLNVYYHATPPGESRLAGWVYLDSDAHIETGFLPNASEGLLKVFYSSLIVHEKLHAYFRRRHIAAVSIQNKSSLEAMAFGGLSKLRYGAKPRILSSFEEAYAELGAADFREQMLYEPGGYDNELYSLWHQGQKIRMPRKFFNIDEAAGRGDEQLQLGHNAELMVASGLAYAFDILNRVTNHDLLTILNQSREPSQEGVQAQRDMAKIIDAIQPGMYKRFRDCPYTDNDALDLLAEVYQLAQHRGALSLAKSEESS